MKIVVAPGSFKGTIRADIAAQTISGALVKLLPELDVISLPLADGGEGTLEVFLRLFGGKLIAVRGEDPLGRPTIGNILDLGTGDFLVQSAEFVGLSLVPPDKRSPLTATSAGLANAIIEAARRNAKRIYVSMGDSATMDMGLGMLQELGARITGPTAGERVCLRDALLIEKIDFSTLATCLSQVQVIGLVDTDDYLTGQIGQVQLYGAQKGLMEHEVPFVEEAYRHLAALFRKASGIDPLNKIRATGSGGIGAAIHSAFNADLLNTLEYVAERTDIARLLKEADLVITGEGKLDNQTRLGKVPYFVAKHAIAPAIALVGDYSGDGERDFCSWNPRNEVIKIKNAFDQDELTALRGSVQSLVQAYPTRFR